MRRVILLSGYLLLQVLSFSIAEDVEDVKTNILYTIEGKVTVPGVKPNEWLQNTRILVDGGAYVGYIKGDGSFKMHLPTGSYVIEISHPTYLFEPQRVDINGKGKTRARKVNNVQPNSVVHLPIPLRFKAKGPTTYFQKREAFRVIDILKSPMVIMMVLPIIFIVIMPKLINTQDPEIQKEMQNMSMMNSKQEMPDLSELATSFFGGGSAKKKEKVSKNKKNK